MGTVEVRPATISINRMTALIWGMSGVGKSTLATTFPGDLLWLLFDPGGTSSIADTPGLYVADYTGMTERVVLDGRSSDDPFFIKRYLRDHPSISTLVFDSLTPYVDMATKEGAKKVGGASFEAPGWKGYGYRNAYVLQTVSNLLRVTGQLNKHCVFICHEDDPEKDEEGHTLSVKPMLGGKQTNKSGLQVDEVWYMSIRRGDHMIAIQPVRQRTPVKTRMFTTLAAAEFKWDYNPETREGMRVEDWWLAWKAGGHKKIALPA